MSRDPSRPSHPSELVGAGGAGRVVLVCGAYAAVFGLASFAGWALDVRRLTDWFGNGISILPNTALAATAAGAALAATALGRRTAAIALGTAAGALGLAVFLEHVTGVDFGIDTLFVFRRPWGAAATVEPGRMGLPAAISWMMSGTAIALLRGGRRRRRAAVVLGLLVVGIGTFSLVGYLFGARVLHAVAIAAPAGIIVLVVGIGLVAAVPECEPLRGLREDSAAGALLRRSLPVLLAAPLLVGLALVWGESAGLFGTAAGTVLLVLVLIAVSSALLWSDAAAVRSHERQEAEALRALRASEERLRSMADNAPVMVRLTEPDGACSYLGRTWYEFTGRPPESGLGFGWLAALHPDDREAARRAVVTAHVRRTPLQLEYRLRRHDGAERWAIDSAVPRLDEPGAFLGTIASVMDITERRDMEQALRESDRRKDEFLAMLAHELRNPLAPLQNASRVLSLRSTKEPQAAKACDIIARQTLHLARLVDDLLDASRITSGKIRLRRERVQLAAVVQAAIELVRPLVERFDHTLVVSQADDPIHLEGDFARLVQLVSNLLTNAAKYTLPDGHITLTTQQTGSEASIRVRDTGVGIPRDLQQRIFDLFVQEDRGLARSEGGLGIGLTLVRRIAELHGGRVEVRSEGSGRGSEFVVTLPALAPAPVLGRRAEPRPQHVRGPAPLRILLVEDNLDAAEGFAMLLGLRGHRLCVTHSGGDALAAVESFEPDVAFIDVGLPGMDGYELAARLRAHGRCRKSVLVALTGYGREEDKRRAMAAGFDHHVTKPADLEAIERLLAGLGGRTARASEAQVQRR